MAVTQKLIEKKEHVKGKVQDLKNKMSKKEE
jgi:hypothetical protein